MGVERNPDELKLYTLRTPDGTYPSEGDADDAPGTPTVANNSVGDEFPNAGEDGCVNLRVELKAVGLKRQHDSDSDTEPEEASRMDFSEIDEDGIKRMFQGVHEDTKFRQSSTKLPKDLEEGLRADYARLVAVSSPPWMARDADKKRYVDAVLTRCIVAVNTAKPDKERLLLRADHPVVCEGLIASGNADWLITRGKGMLVVMEAGDVLKGQYQLMATMEAQRIINKAPPAVHSIKGICTSFQNWLFVERAPKKLRKEMTGSAIPEVADAFPDTMIPICERLYDVLLNL